MSLRGKIILMLVVALAALAAVSAGNYYFSSMLRGTMHLQADIDAALRDLQASRVAETRFLGEGDSRLAEQALKLMDQARGTLAEQKQNAAQDVARTVEQLSASLADYRAEFSGLVGQVKRINQLRAGMLASGADLAKAATQDIVEYLDVKESEQFMETGEPLDDTHANFRNAVKDYRYYIGQVILNNQRLYLNADQKTYADNLKTIKASLKLHSDNVATFLPNIKFEEPKQAWSAIVKDGQAVLAADQELFKLWQANRQAMARMEKNSTKLFAQADALRAKAEDEMSLIEHTSQILGLAVFLVAGAVLVVWGLLMVRSIMTSLGGAVSSLNKVAGQVSNAAQHFSASSTEMATGASQQAASLEETSASLEELASMTKTSADHAREVDDLMQGTTKVVAQAGQAMAGLREAMAKITANSDETAHIIKTIDEIAFQTNLLALNAAVEAARAGEAGAGFAVVADEVRNLAIRAAEAAKNTSDLIEQNIGDVKRGDELAGTTAESFGQVEEGSQSVGGLVSQIAEASQEQAQGIDQISRAASEMDKVTQRVAGNAEETSAASEELNSYSRALGQVVERLNGLLGGSASRGSGRKRREKGQSPEDETLLLPQQ